jgi:hypothetical protein
LDVPVAQIELDGGVCCELLSDQDTAVYAMGWFIKLPLEFMTFRGATV